MCDTNLKVNTRRHELVVGGVATTPAQSNFETSLNYMQMFTFAYMHAYMIYHILDVKIEI